MPPNGTGQFELLAVGITAFPPSQMLMLGLAIGVVTIVMICTRHRIQRSRAASGPTARERYAEQRDEQEARRDLETVMVELDQLSRQVHGRLDTKLAKLETLIRDADDRIEKLARMQRTAAGEPTVDIVLKPEPPTANVPLAADRAETHPHEPVYRLADSGMKPVQIAHELGRNTGEIELILSLRRAKGQPGYSGNLSRTRQPMHR